MKESDNLAAPKKPVRLIFIHHSCGGNWLADSNGGLGVALSKNNYFVSDTNYGWGPGQIGNRTDIGHWWEWFCDPQNSPAYLDALFKESGQNNRSFGIYSRLPDTPPGENEIIMFKSCYPNSALRGNPSAPVPPIERNQLRGQNTEPVPPSPKKLKEHLIYWVKSMVKSFLGSCDNGSVYTVANAKGIYNELLKSFREHADKLFIAVTAPPLLYSPNAAQARAFNEWLVKDWLAGYPFTNVAVFDFYNILTSNGGRPEVNDLEQESGCHHRWWNGAVQHQVGKKYDLLAYPTSNHHPNQAGNQKATAEFVPLLNIYYNRWKGSTASKTKE